MVYIILVVVGLAIFVHGLRNLNRAYKEAEKIENSDEFKQAMKEYDVLEE